MAFPGLPRPSRVVLGLWLLLLRPPPVALSIKHGPKIAPSQEGSEDHMKPSVPGLSVATNPGADVSAGRLPEVTLPTSTAEGALSKLGSFIFHLICHSEGS